MEVRQTLEFIWDSQIEPFIELDMGLYNIINCVCVCVCVCVCDGNYASVHSFLEIITYSKIQFLPSCVSYILSHSGVTVSS